MEGRFSSLVVVVYVCALEQDLSNEGSIVLLDLVENEL